MFNPGDPVCWLQTLRGGYGYRIRVDGIVVRVNAKTVTIRVKLLNGQEVERRVKPENLESGDSGSRSQWDKKG